MRIGIFGGCFSPPHKSHRDIIVKILKQKILDKVIYVPTGKKYPKQDLIDNKYRYEMLELMLKEVDNVLISDYEFNSDLVYAYQTLDYFKSVYPDDEIYFITGTDNLDEFETWRNYEYILSNYKLLVNKRNNDNFDEIIKKYTKYSDNIISSSIEVQDMSSTLVRNLIKENKYDELDNYLELNVIEYIKTNNLYRS